MRRHITVSGTSKKPEFSENLQIRFPWFRKTDDPRKAECLVCGNGTIVKFTILGKCDLIQHMGSLKHRKALQSYDSPLKLSKDFKALHYKALQKDILRLVNRKRKTGKLLSPVEVQTAYEFAHRVKRGSGIKASELVNSVKHSNEIRNSSGSFRKFYAKLTDKITVSNCRQNISVKAQKQNTAKFTAAMDESSKVKVVEETKQGSKLKRSAPLITLKESSKMTPKRVNLKKRKSGSPMLSHKICNNHVGHVTKDSASLRTGVTLQSFRCKDSEYVILRRTYYTSSKISENSACEQIIEKEAQNTDLENATHHADAALETKDERVNIDRKQDIERGETCPCEKCINIENAMDCHNFDNEDTRENKADSLPASPSHEDSLESFISDGSSHFIDETLETDEIDLAAKVKQFNDSGSTGTTTFRRISSKYSLEQDSNSKFQNGDKFTFPECASKLQARETAHNSVLTPLAYFQKFFNKELLSHIVDQTNLYCTQTRPSKSLELTVSEFDKWLAILIYTSVIQLGHISTYWNRLYGLTLVHQTMSEERWLEVQTFLHFNDDKCMPSEGVDSYDNLYEVRPVIRAVRREFGKIPMPQCVYIHRKVSHANDASCLQKQPESMDLPYSVLVDENGVIYNFHLHVDNLQQNRAVIPVKHDRNIALTLAQVIPEHKNHILIIDSKLTTVGLMHILSSRGIFCMGTMPISKLKALDLPADSIAPITDCVQYIEFEHVLKKHVFLQIIKDPNKTEAAFCRSYVTKCNEPAKYRTHSYCPSVVGNYFKFMDTVNKAVSNSFNSINYMPDSISHKIFLQCVMFAIQNAWLLYAQNYEAKSHHAGLCRNIYEFKCSLVQSLINAENSPLPQIA